jgi:hypothetical protein
MIFHFITTRKVITKNPQKMASFGKDVEKLELFSNPGGNVK